MRNANALVAQKPKRPVGRPTSYRSEYCDLIAAAMADGLSAEAAAAKIGISARSLFNWQQIHPEFLQAVQEGRQMALLWWEERARAIAEGAPGSAQIVALGLKNRSRAPSGWHEWQRLEHSGPAGGPIKTENQFDASKLSPEERTELRRLLMLGMTQQDGDE
jgi:hypothetical protein